MTNTQTIHHQDNLAERFEASMDAASHTLDELEYLPGAHEVIGRVRENLNHLDSVMQPNGGLDRLLTVKTD